jgi:diguanylate cyclase (GGDEF)-like protein/PAS domain S-box-containing protein
MHRILLRQLRKLNLTVDTPPTPEAWRQLLARVAATYEQEEKTNYLLERSLHLTSEEMRDLNQRLRNSYEARQRAILQALPDLLFMLDDSGRFIDIMAAQTNLLALPREAMLGRLLEEVLPEPSARRFMAAIHAALQTGQMQLLEYELEVPAGVMHFEGRVTTTGMRVDDRPTVVFLARDITELHHSRNLLLHAAFHDELTGLPNRRMFTERLDQAIAHNRRMGRIGAIYFLDMDRFKYINDSLGHATGDDLLRQVALRLGQACRKDDTLARLGGDEFAILVEELPGEAEVEAMAEKILAACAEPFQLPGLEFKTSVSIGACLFPRHAETSAEALRHADAAMYDSKNSGPGRYRIFTPELQRGATEAFSLEADLRHALQRDELFMMYQPRVELPSRRLSGFEALIRWRHPTRGLVPPDVFIPLAENTGLIDAIGLWLLRVVCEQVAAWQIRGLPFGLVAFNLSRRQLSDAHLASRIAGVLAATGARPEHLECEVTESAIIQQTDVAHRNLHAIVDLGIPLAIDDFGTGHSSLINLKRYPLSRIKIDRAFINDVGKDPNDEAIIRATLAMAASMGLAVTAEGIETPAQEAFLTALGCPEGQGYLYSRPLEVGAAQDLIGSTFPASPSASVLPV